MWIRPANGSTASFQKDEATFDAKLDEARQKSAMAEKMRKGLLVEG
jgi:hypothetical protein